MESKNVMDIVTMVARIKKHEDDSGDTSVYFIVDELESIKINLSDSTVDDIKDFFDRVFDYIIINKKLIEFTLEEGKSDLFYEVSQDIILHLNKEIEQSSDNFAELIKLTKTD